MPRRGRRGYPTAILIGLDPRTANIWLVYSESIKQGKIITKTGDDEKSTYRHNEKIVEAIRSLSPEGFNQIIIASADRTRHASNLREHFTRSHSWLMKRFTVKELPEKALTSTDVIQRVKNHRIQDSLDEAIGETSGKIMERVEKALNSGYVLYTSQELSATLYADKVPELVLITDKFDTANRSNRKFQSIIQKSKNLGATVTIVKINTPAGTRLEQLGGFICVIRQ